MLLQVRVTTKASKNTIIGVKNNVLQVKVTAVPENNEANESVIRLISDLFSIAKSKIRITSGARSRNKILAIDTINTDQIIKKLSAIQGQPHL